MVLSSGNTSAENDNESLFIVEGLVEAETTHDGFFMGFCRIAVRLY